MVATVTVELLRDRSVKAIAIVLLFDDPEPRLSFQLLFILFLLSLSLYLIELFALKGQLCGVHLTSKGVIETAMLIHLWLYF